MPEVGKVIGIHCHGESLMKLVALLLVLQHSRISLTEHSLVEALAETFASLCHLFLDLIVEFSDLLLDEDVGTIAFLGVLIVDQRVVKRIYVPR